MKATKNRDYSSKKAEKEAIAAGDLMALRKKYIKLSQIHYGLGERVSIAEKNTANANNKVNLLEVKLKDERNKVLLGETKVREILNNEFKNKTIKLEKNNTKLKNIIKKDLKTINRMNVNDILLSKKLEEITIEAQSIKSKITTSDNKINSLEALLQISNNHVKILEGKEKIVIPENIHITTLQNKLNSLTIKVISARNRIRTLNANTPYRPGAVESTLKEVLKGLDNVSIN